MIKLLNKNKIMNENIDLIKILKDCPKGWKFWSPIFGEVLFEHNYENKGLVNVSLIEDETEWSFNSDATITIGNIKSIEIMLYPSKENRDWSKFSAPWCKKDRFDPKTLQPFDKVLVRDYNDDKWVCSIFSHIEPEDSFHYECILELNCKYCIPYNEDTKYLVGKNEEAPEFYRYWED